MKHTFAVAIALLVACSGEETPEPTPAPTATVPTPEPSTPEPAPTPEPVAEPAVAPPAAPVDLLHAIPTQVRASTALGDNVAQIERMFDGDPASAWNSKSEDLVGSFVEVRLPPDAQVTAIGLTSGFTRVRDGRDLFHGNQRIQRVRVLRDDVEVGRYPLDIETMELQRLPVTGPGGTYRIEILEVLAGTQATWRETCISELRIEGTAPNATAGSTRPTASIVPADEREDFMAEFRVAVLGEPAPEGEEPIEGEEGDDGEGDGVADADEDMPYDERIDNPPVTEVSEGPRMLQREEGLVLTELTLAPGVEARQAVDPRDTFSRATDQRVYCLIRLENPERVEHQLTMRWERVDRPERGNDYPIRVPAQPRYVSWGYTGTGGRAGTYRCTIKDEEGTLLGSRAYELTE
jgi:hypothetical protein